MQHSYLHKLLTQFIPGMTLGVLWRVLADNGFRVDPRRLDRLAFLHLAGIYNSLTAPFERRDNETAIRATAIEQPPILILGQWRSGTTHLHNLLGCHPDFHCPTLYQTLFPAHFAYSQRLGARCINYLVPATRPMDNVPLAVHTPHEDEFALAALCGISPYLRFLFPESSSSRTALDPRRLSPGDLQIWKDTFLSYLRKLTFSSGRRLVLKSPPHTGRVETILGLLPGAKFIHITRNPYDVFLSSRKLWRDGAAHSHLQRPGPETVDGIILSWHLELFDLFERDRGLIPTGSLVEIRYDDLCLDPWNCLERIFAELNLPGFDLFRPRCEAYLGSVHGYRGNALAVDGATRRIVSTRWRRMFEAYGYPA